MPHHNEKINWKADLGFLTVSKISEISSKRLSLDNLDHIYNEILTILYCSISIFSQNWIDFISYNTQRNNSSIVFFTEIGFHISYIS